ncbi:MAG: hypothetical protein QM703_10750 [Gemmatales bacterium]
MEAVASKEQLEARRRQNMLLFGGIGLAVVGVGLFQFGKDAWSASQLSSRRVRQPWDAE